MESKATHPGSNLPTAISQSWFARPSCEVAQDLLGCYLVREQPQKQQFPNSSAPSVQWARIVETEAYGANPGQPEDPAMHLYRKPTSKKAVVFGPAGFAYIYAIYGRYHCFNVVTDQTNIPSTILIRAVELLPSPPSLSPAPNPSSQPADVKAGAGPSKLCRVLDLDRPLSETPLHPGQPIWLAHRQPAWQQRWDRGAIAITQTQRIGLSRGIELPWRWYLSDSAAVSKT